MREPGLELVRMDQACTVLRLVAESSHFLERVEVPPGGMRLDVRLEQGLAIEGFA